MIQLAPAAVTDGEFDSCFGCLLEPALDELDQRLREIHGLGDGERRALIEAGGRALTDTVRRKVSRVLLVELNAARVNGKLTGSTSEQRWSDFIELASTIEFWHGLKASYPTLWDRLATIVERRAAATLELARRWCADRPELAGFIGVKRPELRQVDFGQGDSHRGGRSVAKLVTDSGQLIYKPRSLAIDHHLNELLALVFGSASEPTSPIRAARVLQRAGYGWSEFIEHRYCADSQELRCYYTGIGHWLAIARLLGTTDLHAENMIACGPTPVLIDCETLFTPMLELAGLGMGQATDLAFRMISSTVVESGLLPGRGTALGWRGVDISATGSLPGQQPMMPAQRIVDAGTDRARLATELVPAGPAANLPSPQPELGRYWPDVLAGFDWMVDRLTELDRSGELAPAMRGFAAVEVRAVLRATESYAELARMLWHPISLHDEPAALARASELLAKQARIRPSAPSDPAVIAAEVADLLTGDVPFFVTTARDGQLTGPRATRWGNRHDLIEHALASWRSAELDTERELIRASLVSAYYNEGWQPERDRMTVESISTDRLDDRRSRLAESVLHTLITAAVRGQDGTATWIAPVFNVTGWSVQPLTLDGYSGASGVALLLAGYLREAAAGRVSELAGLPELLDATVSTMRRAAERGRQMRAESAMKFRPDSPGLYVGIGSQIWTWLWLDRLGITGGEGCRQASQAAQLLPEAVAASEEPDLLVGKAGAIVALLMLSEQSGDSSWLQPACAIGDELAASASWTGDTACWLSPRWPAGLGGFAHGATGTGWALARLSQVSGRADYAELAEAALAFERSLFRPELDGWRDLREAAAATHAWCHGSIGIGLAAADLLRRGFGDPAAHTQVVRQAAQAAWQHGFGLNHTMCHGDLGTWELLATAEALGLAPAGFGEAELQAQVVGSVEKYRPTSGLARDALAPGLLPGVSGIAYQLLRMHQDCELPSVLVLG